MDMYETKDMGISALLITLGNEMKDIDWRGNTAYFLFNNKEKCQALSEQYLFRGMLVNARQFFDSIKMLKRMIIESRPK